MTDYFPSSYEDSRDRFRHSLSLLQSNWPHARLDCHPLIDRPDLSIDWMWAEPKVKENLVIISTGEHGIEGYVGAAMMKIFIEEFTPKLNPANTGLLLIHAINPWGMKHRRKVNENNVDLNRNFTYDGVFNPSNNPYFLKLKRLIAPDRPISSFGMETMRIAWGTIWTLITRGLSTLRYAALLGQYVEPNAMYYGGARHEEQTQVMMELFHQALQEYQTVIHLDMHAGYGPRYQMSIILVPLEPLSSTELSAKFNYPLVLRGDHQEFYATHGDMTEYFYRLQNEKYPDKHAFSCAFECGTYGESILQEARSLRTMVFESQLYAYGTKNKKTEEKVRHEFEELYFPAELKWREKALADGRQAFEGIFQAYQLLK